MTSVLQCAYKAAQVSDVTVLLQGETGTGKQVLARAIHSLDQKRCKFRFVTVHCSTVSEMWSAIIAYAVLKFIKVTCYAALRDLADFKPGWSFGEGRDPPGLLFRRNTAAAGHLRHSVLNPWVHRARP